VSSHSRSKQKSAAKQVWCILGLKRPLEMGNSGLEEVYRPVVCDIVQIHYKLVKLCGCRTPTISIFVDVETPTVAVPLPSRVSEHHCEHPQLVQMVSVH